MKLSKNIYYIYEDEIPCDFYIIKLQGNSSGYFSVVENTPWDNNNYTLSKSELLKKFNNDKKLKIFIDEN